MKGKVHLLYKAIPSRLRDVALLPNIWKQAQRAKQNEEMNILQMKEQDKNLIKNLNEII